MNTFQLSQIITKPTRITQFSKTCIDHIWTLRPELFTNWGVITIPVSDHLLIFGIRKSPKRPKGQPRIINARSYRRFNNNDFIKDLEQAPWSSIEVSNDPDLAWSIFESLFTPIYDAHAPFKQVKIPNNQPQWINDEYLACRIDLVRTRSRAQKSFSDADWLAYRNLRNKINNLATRLKREFIETSISNAGTDTCKLWKTIKTVLPGSKHDVISSLRVGDSITNDGKLIADNFNIFFSTIGENLAKAFNSTQDMNHIRLEETTPGDFHFTKIPEDDVLKLLKGIDGNKATGLDNISPKLLKIGYAQLCRPLAYIMNLSLTSGVVPSAWKKSRVSPIFKEGDHLDTSNVRPISVIPACMKIFEKFVHNQLYHFVTDYNLLSSNQYGFRAMHSTQTCLLEVTDYLLDNFNSGLYTGVVFLDLKKAFDTVHHKVLLNKLQSIGVQGSELNWFESYLYNRQQVTKIGDFMSSPAFVNFGVPQGSILGPLLFTLYINSLSSVITNSNAKVTLYADDTAIFVKGKSVSNINDIMNTEISKVAKWLNENFLTLNVKKTKGMLLCNSQKMTRRDTDLEVYINNSLIDNVGKFKYLGVWLDPALTWNEQIDKISKTVSKRNGLLHRLRNVLPQKKP